MFVTGSPSFLSMKISKVLSPGIKEGFKTHPVLMAIHHEGIKNSMWKRFEDNNQNMSGGGLAR